MSTMTTSRPFLRPSPPLRRAGGVKVERPSAARPNDLDTDQRRKTITRGGRAPATQDQRPATARRMTTQSPENPVLDSSRRPGQAGAATPAARGLHRLPAVGLGHRDQATAAMPPLPTLLTPGPVRRARGWLPVGGLLAGWSLIRLGLRFRGRTVRARRLRGVRGVSAYLPPQRLQLDPQRLDQHRLLGQLGGLLGHKSRQLRIRGRRLGHGRESSMIKHRTPAPTHRRSSGGSDWLRPMRS